MDLADRAASANLSFGLRISWERAAWDGGLRGQGRRAVAAIRCGIDELAASFVESGAVGYGGLEVDDLGASSTPRPCAASPWLARRCEDLLAEHEEHVAVLYSYRSVSKAIPYYAGEEEARVRGLIVATLGDALAPVLDAMRFADRAVEFCDIKRLQQAMPDGWPATGEANAGPLSASDFEELTEALLLRDLRRAVADEYYWKLTHPSISGLEDGSAHDKRTVPFAAAVLHNYSGREKSVLVDAICLAKSLAQTLADAAPGLATKCEAHVRSVCGHLGADELFPGRPTRTKLRGWRVAKAEELLVASDEEEEEELTSPASSASTRSFFARSTRWTSSPRPRRPSSSGPRGAAAAAPAADEYDEVHEVLEWAGAVLALARTARSGADFGFLWRP
ncbi:hypothetical protein JL722_15295 [Aureococcus anophagefferens]|nr:hypothetical protein JL722_15295 [Aureococcus anophagefferens]